MTATFDDLLSTERDRLRFLLGDTNTSNALIEDETYDAVLEQSSDWRLAGAQLADGLAARFAQEPDTVTVPGEISVSWRTRVARWVQLAASWRAEVAASIQSIVPERDYEPAAEYSGGVYEGPYLY